MLRSHQQGWSLVKTVIVCPHSLARRWVSIIADMIVSAFEGVMSINGVYNSSRGKFYTMSLVSTKRNIARGGHLGLFQCYITAREWR